MNVIGASWLATHEYCEYKLYLDKILKIRVPESEEMVIGRLIHQEKEGEFLKWAEPGTWEEFLKAEELTIAREVALKKQIGNTIISGVIDEIAIDKDFIYIIDDKPNAFPFNTVKKQLSAYCYLFKENFSSSKKLFAVLRDRDRKMVVWQKEYDGKLEEEFFIAFHRIRKIILLEEEPIATDNPNKCLKCRFNKVCEKSLV